MIGARKRTFQGMSGGTSQQNSGKHIKKNSTRMISSFVSRGIKTTPFKLFWCHVIFQFSLCVKSGDSFERRMIENVAVVW